MAVVEPIRKPIKAHQYVYDSIAYVLSPENRNGDEKCFRATCLNCVNDRADGLSKQFYETRRAFNKDDKILSHHYVQSFSPNEKVTPELVHKIGVELAEKIAPGFQVIVSTHVDKDHIHNHFIINSVSMETGLKWKGNKTTLEKIMRPESDKLCKKYGLTIIDHTSGLNGIDQTTQKLAEQGKSWKVDLCNSLDEATKICNSKKEFISFMKNKKFEITRYGEKDITFKKIGEKKGIRASRLARQFGDCYTKESLEKLMGFYKPPRKSESPVTPKSPKPQKPVIGEFEKYENYYFKNNPPLAKKEEARIFQKFIKNSSNPFFLLLLIIMKLLIRRNRKTRIDKKYRSLHSRCKQQKAYRTKKTDLKQVIEKYEQNPTTAGNIPYRNLVSAHGENYRVRLALSAVPKLYAYPFFFSARLYRDYALVTIKKKDKQILQKALELEDEKIIEKHNNRYTSIAEYDELKQRAEQLGVKVEFLMLHQPELLEKLKNEKERFVAIPTKDGKIRLAFLPQNKDYILHALYPDRYKNNNNLFSVGRNSKVNTKLKKEAMLGGQVMRYRELSKEEVEKIYRLSDDKELFAVFNKNAKGESLNGKYQIVYKSDDEDKINEALEKMPKRKI